MSRYIRSLLLSSIALAAVAPVASASSGGFTPGDLYFSILGPQSPFPDGGSGIARIDWQTGNVSVLLDMPANSTPGNSSMAYDPFRDRIVFAGIPFTGAPLGSWAIDASGVYTSLHTDNNAWPRLISPAGNGRIYYCFDSFAGQPHFRYLDANDNEQILMDSTGAAPYSAAWEQFATEMTYDAPSNSLIVALYGAANSICSGASTNFVVVRKLPLSADGSRVAGPESCAQFQISPIGNLNAPCGIGRLPNGDVLLPIDPNASGVDAVFLRVDPSNLAISTFASLGSGIPLKFGGYSSALWSAFDIDILTHTVRLYPAGSSGSGGSFSTSVPISPAGNTPMAWIEIPGAACNVATYCTAKTTSHSCVPSISATGAPSASAGSGFTIQAANVEPMKNGVLFYCYAGPAAQPFQGGTFCLKFPVKRTPPTNSGGAANCSGVLSMDFNAWIATGFDPGLVAGAQIWAQDWFRDPTAPFGTGLSNALTFHICP